MKKNKQKMKLQTCAFSYKAAFGTEYTPGIPTASGVLTKPSVWYMVGLGPLWFLQVLLVFNMAFCCIYPKGLDSMSSGIPLPGFMEMLLLGSVLGLFQVLLFLKHHQIQIFPFIKL